MAFNASEEGRHTAAVFFSGVEQLRLVHGDPHRQPWPQRQQLQYNTETKKSASNMGNYVLRRFLRKRKVMMEQQKQQNGNNRNSG